MDNKTKEILRGELEKIVELDSNGFIAIGVKKHNDEKNNMALSFISNGYTIDDVLVSIIKGYFLQNEENIISKKLKISILLREVKKLLKRNI